MEDEVAAMLFFNNIGYCNQHFKDFIVSVDRYFSDKEKFKRITSSTHDFYPSNNSKETGELTKLLRESKISTFVSSSYEGPFLRIRQMSGFVLDGRKKIRQYVKKVKEYARIHNLN